MQTDLASIRVHAARFCPRRPLFPVQAERLADGQPSSIIEERERVARAIELTGGDSAAAIDLLMRPTYAWVRAGQTRRWWGDALPLSKRALQHSIPSVWTLALHWM